jgi:ABC-type Mn2+/Zn2+ transport system ATPase subunit
VGAEALFAAHGLSLGYGESPVLRDVDLTVRSGDFWCWIGPNGSGKSTLLRGFLGLLRPLAGELHVAKRLQDHARLGYVPQRSELSDALPTTVRELVELGLVRSAVPRGGRAAALAWALGQVGLAGLERRSVWSLSGGQRQRALLARALVRRPELLVLDEPTEGLDVTTNDALLETLAALHREAGLTLLVVTHRLEIARERADHVALFVDGRVIAGPRDAVLSGREAERAFAGRGLALP